MHLYSNLQSLKQISLKLFSFHVFHRRYNLLIVTVQKGDLVELVFPSVEPS